MEREKIGTYVRSKRTALGMTQQQLAEKIQVTEKAVSRWETGRGVPDISLLEPLAEELGVSVTELLNGEDRKKDTAESGVQEQAEHKEEMTHIYAQKQTDQAVETVIAYVQENRKEKYQAGFAIGVGCFVLSALLFLLYLRDAYRFAGNYFRSLFQVVAASGAFLAGEAVMEYFYREKLAERKKWRRVTLAVLFLYYIVMLFNLTFLERHAGAAGSNLIPFRTIWDILQRGDTYEIAINIFGNFLIFMPLGFFLIELFHMVEGKRYLMLALLVTAGVEILQFITKTGVLDVDDMILFMGGMMTFFCISRICRKNADRKNGGLRSE